MSPSVEHLRGYTAEEVMAKPLDDALTSEGRAKVGELINKGMSQFINGKETQKYFTEVLEQPCKDGSTVWTEVITKYNWNIKTGAVEIYGVTRDITERYRADLEIRKLSAATQQSPASIVITDLDGNIEYVNPKFTRVTGYSLEEIIGKNPRILKSGDKPKSYYNELWNTIKAGKEWRGEFINRKKNGEIYYELGVISPINDSNGTIMNFLAVKEDISERKLAEIALQESEEKFRILVDTTPTGIFIAIGDRLVFANNALSAISTYSIDELKGMWHLEFIHPKYKELTKKRIEALTSGEAASSFEIMIVTKNGYEKWVLVAAASINYGGKSAVIGSMIDISERIAMENQLKEINSTKDRFFSIIAHDLRSPMGSFKGITKLLADSYKDFTEAEITEIINSLKISSESIYNLLENLLEWANTQRGAINYQPTEINLKLLFNSNITLLKQIADNKNISLQNDLRDDFVLFADANLLNTIIRNLVSNAIKFTPKGGSILLNAETNDYGSVISVKDSGVGITADAISKLFKINEIYTTPGTLNEKGSGLGLILSKEFVNRHGGEIWVESEPGKGSTFKFSLPNRPSN